jgi:hypothetical protein
MSRWLRARGPETLHQGNGLGDLRAGSSNSVESARVILKAVGKLQWKYY